MAKQILKAELAAQNSALRAEVSQLKADLERYIEQSVGYEAYITELETEARARRNLPAEAGPVRTRAQLMAQAKAVAKAKGCTTKILDGQVLYHDGANWQVAA